MRCFHCRSEVNWANTQHCPRCGISGFFLRTGTLLKSGEYYLENPLGKGGFGITYQARHQRLNRLVAIKEFFPRDQSIREPTGKVVPLPEDEEFYLRWRGRFIREGLVLAQVNHRNVVRAIDVFEDNGTAYLVMDLIVGSSLKKELTEASGRCLSISRTRAVMTQLVAALEAVHSQKIYHLDLKPDNVMVTEGERVVLVDFGAARQASVRTEVSLTSTQQLTKSYAPPELIEGETVGPESDLFELAMMLHEMLYGVLPANASARMRKDIDFDLVTWEEPWRRLLMSALEMDRDKRTKRIGVWWDYERQYRERKERAQREEKERLEREEKERWLREIDRLKRECEKLSGIVRDLENRESQALNQIGILDYEVGKYIEELDEQAVALQFFKKYEPLINRIEMIREVGGEIWNLYLEIIELLLNSAARKNWISKPPQYAERQLAHRYGIVIITICIFVLLFILLFK